MCKCRTFAEEPRQPGVARGNVALSCGISRQNARAIPHLICGAACSAYVSRTIVRAVRGNADVGSNGVYEPLFWSGAEIVRVLPPIPFEASATGPDNLGEVLGYAEVPVGEPPAYWWDSSDDQETFDVNC
jgi:hypothetical protein